MAIGAALVCACVAAGLGYVELTRSRAPAAATRERVRAVTAAREIRAGEILSGADLHLAEVPATRATASSLRRLADAEGRVAGRPIPAGAPVTADALLEASVALGPAYALPNHLRAVTVGVDAVRGITGFLKPGDRVDVLASFSRNHEAIARVVLQDVEVVAVGTETAPTSIAPDEERGSPRTVSASQQVPVTLAVTVDEAERLVLADQHGRIRLALRPARGAGYTRTRGATLTQLSGLGAGRPRPPAPSVAPPLAPARVTVTPSFAPPPPSATPRPAALITERSEHQVIVVRGTRLESVDVPLESAGGREGTPGADAAGGPGRMPR